MHHARSCSCGCCGKDLQEQHHYLLLQAAVKCALICGSQLFFRCSYCCQQHWHCRIQAHTVQNTVCRLWCCGSKRQLGKQLLQQCMLPHALHAAVLHC
jgi:hypothetical protein